MVLIVLRCKVFHMLLQSARNLTHTLMLLFAASLLAACSTPGPTASQYPESRKIDSAGNAPNSLGERAAEVAVGQIGVPYRYGGQSTNGFDCSGLVHYSYARAGKSVPRTTAGLWGSMDPVPGSEIRVGDILFFHIEGKMSHVGLYLGDGRFVHAPATGRSVSTESLNNEFYRQAFVRAGRP